MVKKTSGLKGLSCPRCGGTSMRYSRTGMDDLSGKEVDFVKCADCARFIVVDNPRLVIDPEADRRFREALEEREHCATCPGNASQRDCSSVARKGKCPKVKAEQKQFEESKRKSKHAAARKDERLVDSVEQPVDVIDEDDVDDDDEENDELDEGDSIVAGAPVEDFTDCCFLGFERSPPLLRKNKAWMAFCKRDAKTLRRPDKTGMIFLNGRTGLPIVMMK